MTNILKSVIANQPIYPKHQDSIPAFTFDTNGKVKPMEDKGKLLPSRIFSSPIEYAKDLKQDIVSIGKAAKGQANDHELGRINDVAMKLGALGLASYLFVKNPLKLSKTMEFIGAGTFFASMALWPKLAIQAPLKARTGVDVHQKYIDSQGRKKMLFQDPQYVLTDMYTREDLDKIGDKLGVSKKLDDRDSFIKQRAQKTALQANTLWMTTAGIATPVMSALGCNVLEKPIGKLIENHNLKSTSDALYGEEKIDLFSGIKNKIRERKFNKFIQQHAKEPMSEKMIGEISSQIGGSKIITDAVKQQLSQIHQPVDENFVKTTLRSIVPENVYSRIQGSPKEALKKAISGSNFRKIADILAEEQEQNIRAQSKLADNIFTTLESAYKSQSTPTVEQASSVIKQLHSGVKTFNKRNGIIGKFISARVGQNAESYGAKQWGRFSDALVKSLHLSTKELKKVADGDMSIIEEKLSKLAQKDSAKEYDKVVTKLMKFIGDYQEKTDILDPKQGQHTLGNMYNAMASQLRLSGCDKIADRVPALAKVTTREAQKNAQGAKATLFRILQTMDLYKQIENNSYQKRLEGLLQSKKLDASADTIKKLVAASKRVLMKASISDHVEKFTTPDFRLSDDEFKVVMEALFTDKGKHSEVAKSLKRTMGVHASSGLIERFKESKDKIFNKVVNSPNTITPELARRTVKQVTSNMDAEARNTVIGDTMHDAFQRICKKSYNSKKWLHMFGGILAGLTAVTIIAGLFIGRKGTIEKQAEAEKGNNV